MEGKTGRARPQPLPDHSGGKALGFRRDQQAEDLEPRLLGERGEGGKRGLFIHMYLNIY